MKRSTLKSRDGRVLFSLVAVLAIAWSMLPGGAVRLKLWPRPALQYPAVQPALTCSQAATAIV